MTDAPIIELADEIIEEITKDAINNFRQALADNKLVFTQELYESFQYNIVRNAEMLYSEISFKQYGRYKDMKELKFSSHIPPVDAMEFFVEKTGVDKFAWVPGYKQNDGVPTEIATRRIAWAIASHYNRVPSIKRGYKGTWYNENVMLMINTAKKRLRWRASEWISAKIAESLGQI